MHDLSVGEPQHLIAAEGELRVVSDVAAAVRCGRMEGVTVDLDDEPVIDQKVHAMPGDQRLRTKLASDVPHPTHEEGFQPRV